MTARAEIVQEEAPASTVLVPRLERSTLLRPIAGPKDILESQEATRALIAETLLEGRDYGMIPGIKKPSLFKPGAERVGIAFGCYPRYRIIEQEIDHDRPVEWRKKKRVYNNAHKGDRSFTEAEETGQSLGLYRYVVECEIVERVTNRVVGACIGVCSTMEAKYVDRPRECENTALKMAEKRAHVGAVLNAFGLSEQFTQDVEDLPPAQGAAVQEEQLEEITNATPIPFGRMKDKTLAELDVKLLEWMTEEGRKFGPRTADWQKASADELDRREIMADVEEREESAPPAEAKEPAPTPAPASPAEESKTSKRACYARIKAALQSTAISLEIRDQYAHDNINSFKQHPIEWWANRLESFAGRAEEVEA